MKLSELRQLIREEVKAVMITESNIKYEPGKFTLKKGNEVATFEYSSFTYEWYGKLKRDGKLVIEEFNGGYGLYDQDNIHKGSRAGNIGTIPKEKREEMGIGLLIQLYNEIRSKIRRG